LEDRKGAIETFDAYGYLALLQRLQVERDHVVLAPAFVRELEEPIAGSIAIDRDVNCVITEGNYLLAIKRPWPSIRDAIDEIWYLDLESSVRRGRLVDRHVRYGKSLGDAEQWVDSVDDRNAQLIVATRDRANVNVDVTRL